MLKALLPKHDLWQQLLETKGANGTQANACAPLIQAILKVSLLKHGLRQR
jgi:hypothetical protein